MQDIAAATTLVSGHPWPELREMINEQIQQARPQIYVVQDMVLTPTPPVELSYLDNQQLKPHQLRQEIIRLFEETSQDQMPIDGACQLGVAKSLTFGAQTGRGSDNGCATKRILEPRYAQLIQLVHQLAQSAKVQALPYLGFQILKQHRDYHTHMTRTTFGCHLMHFGGHIESRK